MTTSLKPLAVGEVWRTGFNTRLAKIASILSSFPGSQLQSGTVGNDRLGSRRAVASHTLCHGGIGGKTNGDILWGGRIPQFDAQADSSWYIKSASIFVRSLASATSNSLVLYKNGTTTGNSIDLGALTSGVPGRTGGASPALSAWSAVTMTTDDYWDVRFTKSGSPTIDDVVLVLYFAKYHVTNG